MVGRISMPRLLRVGAGASLHLPEALKDLGCRKPLLVTDSFLSKSGVLKPVQAALSEASMVHHTFDGAVPDPTTASLDEGIAAALMHESDVIVGFGGGSAMDSAKAIAVMAVHGGHLSRFKVPAEAPVGLPIVAVPTTAGTGSEVTKVSIVIDSVTEEKMLIMGAGMLPDAALVDYELTMAKPYRLTADSGLDTFCHAMEAYVSKKATPFTDTLALAAASATVKHLPTACATPSDRQAREGMMLAATQAGLAFSNASVTLIHGMSRPIGARFHVPHGLSNAILLPKVTEFSLKGAPSRYADISRACGFASAAETSDAAACKSLVDGLMELTTSLKVPTMSEFGIGRESFDPHLETMAEQALASGSPANNPVVPTASELVTLYKEVYA